MNKCDRCGKHVPKEEDIWELEAFLPHFNPLAVLLCSPRHIRCSPSRAQFITDLNVVDDRPQFDKRLINPEECRLREAMYTHAYHRHLEHWKEQKERHSEQV